MVRNVYCAGVGLNCPCGRVVLFFSSSFAFVLVSLRDRYQCIYDSTRMSPSINVAVILTHGSMHHPPWSAAPVLPPKTTPTTPSHTASTLFSAGRQLIPHFPQFGIPGNILMYGHPILLRACHIERLPAWPACTAKWASSWPHPWVDRQAYKRLYLI